MGLGETVAEGVKLAGAALSEMIEDLGDNLAAQADRLSGTLGLGVGAAGNSHLGRGVEEEAVRVVARLRPQRRPLGRRSARLRAAHGSVQILGEVRAALPATFQLDALLEEHASQEQAYVHTVRPLLPRFLGGARCAVLFCGASGTGKTHSAFGTASVLSNLAAAADSEWGVAPRASRDLFETLGEAVGAGGELQVSVSWLEVRGDQCYDLLDGGKLLRLRESPALGTHAPGLARRPAECHDDVLRHIAHGARRRSTAPTRANMHATRAHTVFTLHLRRRTRRRGRMAPPDACLTLVDLAAGAAGGAHQYVQQQPQPVRARRSAEEAAIHSSLGALSTYLEALRTAQGGGRRRRRARTGRALTRLVQPMVTGPHPFLIAAMASCAVGEADMADTIATLRLATLLRGLRTAVRASPPLLPPAAAAAAAAAASAGLSLPELYGEAWEGLDYSADLPPKYGLEAPPSPRWPQSAPLPADDPRPRARLLCTVERRAAALGGRGVARPAAAARRRRQRERRRRERRRRLRRRASAAAHVAAAAPAAARPFVVGAPARRLLGQSAVHAVRGLRVGELAAVGLGVGAQRAVGAAAGAAGGGCPLCRGGAAARLEPAGARLALGRRLWAARGGGDSHRDARGGRDARARRRRVVGPRRVQGGRAGGAAVGAAGAVGGGGGGAAAARELLAGGGSGRRSAGRYGSHQRYT